MFEEALTIDELIARQDRPVAFFIGSGLSAAEPTSLPFSKEAVLSLMNLDWVEGEKFPCPEISQKSDLFKIRFEHLISIFQEWHHHDLGLLLKQFADAQPNAYHKRIAGLCLQNKVSLLLTTNFDSCLEKACRSNGVASNEIVTEKDNVTREALNIFKLHGTIRFEDGKYSAIGLGATLQAIYNGLEEWKKTILTSIAEKYTIVFLGYSGSDSYDINPLLLDLAETSFVWVQHGVPDKPTSPEIRAILKRSKFPHPFKMDTTVFLGCETPPQRKDAFKFTPTYNKAESFGHPSKFVGRVLESIQDYASARSYYEEVLEKSTGSKYLMVEILDLFRARGACSYELKDYKAAQGSLTTVRILLMDYMKRLETDTSTSPETKKAILLDQSLLLDEEQAIIDSALGEHERAQKSIKQAIQCLESMQLEEKKHALVKSRLLLNKCSITLHSLDKNQSNWGEYLLALDDLTEAYELKEEIGDVLGLIQSLGLLTRVYIHLEDAQAAESIILQMFKEIQRLKSPINEQVINESIAYLSFFVYARLTKNKETIALFFGNQGSTSIQLNKEISFIALNGVHNSDTEFLDSLLKNNQIGSSCMSMETELNEVLSKEKKT